MGEGLSTTRRKNCSGLLLFSHQVVPDSCDPTDCSMRGVLSPTVSWGLPKFMAIASVMPSNNLTLCRPLLLLPSILPSIRVFSNKSAVHIKWSTYWSFSFSFSPSSEYSGLISFKTDWFDLLAVQGTPHCSCSSSSLGIIYKRGHHACLGSDKPEVCCLQGPYTVGHHRTEQGFVVLGRLDSDAVILS